MKQTVRSISLENASWLNYSPLGKRELLGKVVLLDFFSYCCINCLNVLEELKRLEDEFKKELLVIGIHSGKHPHEKEDEAILDAMRRYKIKHCVINDADMKLWDGYGIKAWPTMVLIDPQAYVVKQYQGEGHLEELRRDIKRLTSGHELSNKTFIPQKEKEEKRVLEYPQKILASQEYLFVSHSDEVLVCSYEGEILHKITELGEPQGMVYINQTLYIALRAGNCIIEVNENFSKRSIWRKELRNPYDLETDGELLYVAMAGAHQIKSYDLKSKEERISIGQENSESLYDGAFDEAVLAQPSGLGRLEDELWFVDSESSSLRCASYGEVKSHIYDSDELQHPLDLCVGRYGEGCGGGRIFIADSYNNKIKVYNPQTDELINLIEGLDEPSGISKKECKLYICNTNRHEIILFDLSQMQRTVLVLKE